MEGGIGGGGGAQVAGPGVVTWASLEVGVRGGCGGRSYEQQIRNCLYEACTVLLRGLRICHVFAISRSNMNTAITTLIFSAVLPMQY